MIFYQHVCHISLLLDIDCLVKKPMVHNLLKHNLFFGVNSINRRWKIGITNRHKIVNISW